MKAPTQPGSLVTRSEIRKMLCDSQGKPMSRSRIAEVVAQENFPAPVDVVHPGTSQPIWLRTAIADWVVEHRRGPGRPTDAEVEASEGAVVPDQPLS